MSDTVQTIAERLQSLIDIVNKCRTDVKLVLQILEESMDDDYDFDEAEETEEDTDAQPRKLLKGK